MNPDDRLREVLNRRTEAIDPSPDGLEQIQEMLMHAQHANNRNRVLLGIGAAAAIVAVVVGAIVLTDDDDQVDSVGSTTSLDTTTTESSTTTEEETTTTFAPTVDAATAIFPDPSTSQRFDDPVALATAFASGPMGFASPIVGPFQQGDNRSGEVEVQPFEDGAATVVLVRQLEDDTWFVLGAGTDSIRLATPAAAATITSPQALEGMAYAFEGTVQVFLFADGSSDPIAETFVTGRGDGVLGDFTGELTFTAPDGVDYGYLLLTSASGEDGSTIAAQVLRVAF